MDDTIVIGNDLSSLAAATFISCHGRKTLLLTEGDNQYIYTESGYTFPIDPFPLTGFGPEQTYSRLFSSLSLRFEEIPNPRLLNPCFQIILPDHRIDFFHDKGKLFREIEREFPGHGEEIRRLYGSIAELNDFFEQWISRNPYFYPRNYNEFVSCIKNIPGLTKETVRLSRTIQTITKNPSLYRVFEAQMMLFSHYFQDSRIPSNMFTAYILSLPWRGVYYHSTGKESLMRSLRSIFIQSGGRMINACSVNSVDIGNEITIHIDIKNELSTLKGRRLVASTRWEKCVSLLLNDRRLRRLKRRLKSLQVLSYPFSLHMGVHEKGVPEMMATYVAISGKNGNENVYNNIVFLETSFCGEAERAPHGKRALSATVFLKESPLTLSDEELNNMCESIFQTLESFLPFLRENLDYINVNKSIEIARKNQGLMRLKYSMDTAPFFGLQNLSCKTPLRNVYITGDMLLPGLGFEGEILSGVNSAREVISPS